MGSNKIRPVASVRIVGGVVPSVDTNINSLAVQSVTRLSIGRYQVNCESNSQWDTTNTEIQVTAEAATGTAIYATVEPRVSGAYFVVNIYTGNGAYGTQVDASFYARVNNSRGAWE